MAFHEKLIYIEALDGEKEEEDIFSCNAIASRQKKQTKFFHN